ncbi:MAG: preprotein translocase subunit SecG [Hyphomicrobiaceae bacterium]|nr:preprotein translocase subunit SecG [Hyphomicrobiaceae bacterium]
MVTVILLIHIMVAAALVAVVLLQRSEGGALGIGGGGGAGGFLTGRGTANLLTRVTAGLAAAFFVTSTILSLMAQRGVAPASVFDEPAGQRPASEGPATPGKDGGTPRGGILDRLQPPGTPTVPQTR